MSRTVADPEDLVTGRPPLTPGPVGQLIRQTAESLTDHRSVERVYGPDPHDPGRVILLYPVGSRVPLEEAIRQGLAAAEPTAKPKRPPRRRKR